MKRDILNNTSVILSSLFVLAVILMLLITCSDWFQRGEKENDETIFVKNDFSYKEEPIIPLEEKYPGSDLTLIKGFPFNDIEGYSKISIHFYEENKEDNNQIKGLYAYLYDGKRCFKIKRFEIVSLEYINMIIKDVDNDNLDELIIQLTLFHTSSTVIGYSDKDNEWEILLQTGDTDFVDFNNNGKEILVTTGMGSISPVVNIHFWVEDHFETLDVAGELAIKRIGIVYKGSDIYQEQDLVESNEQRRYFQFKDNTIIEVEDPFKF